MSKLRFIGLAAGIGLAFGLANVGTASAQDILVGVAGPMTGQYATFGTQLKNGAELAVADINAAGGVMGKKLKLDVEDDACDPKQAHAVAEKLVGMKVPFVDGHFCSGSSIPASDVYAEAGVLQITPASTNPKFTERGLWNTFRVCGRDDQQGAVAGKYIVQNYKGKKVAILQDKSTYGKGLADETKKAMNKAGMKEAMYEAYTAGEKDYNALVSRMKQAGIDVVYVGGYHTEAGLILRQMRAQGMKAQMISGDALATNEFWSITGDAGEGMIFTFGPDPRKKKSAAEVVKRFKAKGIDPEGYTLYTYAAMQVWAGAVKKAKTTDPKKVAAAVRAGHWDTVLGPISYDKKGDITKLDYVFYKWSKGKYGEIE
jgi:branched-chain amino acid transport system substrate-binding protein